MPALRLVSKGAGMRAVLTGRGRLPDAAGLGKGGIVCGPGLLVQGIMLIIATIAGIIGATVNALRGQAVLPIFRLTAVT